MTMLVRHWHKRDVRFLGLIAVAGLAIALHLGEGLRLAAREGSGHRVIDLKALERRIEAGDISEREALWYHQTSPDEMIQGGGRTP